jgi:anaerobic ribonucleoside-triphosphate reductase
MSEFGTCSKCGRPLVNLCPDCGQEMDTYSRVVGYLRPTKLWNDGKQREFVDRKTFTTWDGDHIPDWKTNT